MATAPVLPSSRKQEHLEAGKRRLEEFRKKKAAERAKKAAGSSQPHASDVVQDLTQPLDTERVQHTDSDVAGTSDRPNGTIETFDVSIDNKNNIMDVVKKVEHSSLNDEDDNRPSISDYDRTSADIVHRQTNNLDLKRHESSKFLGPGDINDGQETNEMDNNSFTRTGSQGGPSYQNLANHSVALQPQVSQQFDSSPNQSSLYGTASSFLPKGIYSLKNSAGSHISTSTPNYAVTQLQAEPSSTSILSLEVGSQHPSINLSRSSQVEQDMHGGTQLNSLMNPNSRERNSNSFLSVPAAASVQGTEYRGFNLDARSSSNHVPLHLATSESSSRRTRPSFLDSINVPRTSTGLSFLHTELEKEFNAPNSLKSNGTDFLGSLAFQKPSIDNGTLGPFLKSQPPSAPGAIEHSMDYLVSSNNGTDQLESNLTEDNMESKHGFYSANQNEDFSALEQHIEDLTQEKFALQRALDASRALSESLAAENSSLTDSYNQQRSVVDQLKSDMGRLQEEIKAYLAELESVRSEYGNAQLECNAADERAKLLASEVIGLEEKALRLRSNELRLERDLENSHTEMSSYRKKISSLEKDRQNLQSTIDALQEEKKLLQSKLRKASASGKSMDVSRSSSNKKDISTSTEDLDVGPDNLTQHIKDTESGGSHGFPVLSENGAPDLDLSLVNIPPDQMRMIQNINTLISELALEKEELMQAFASESSQCSKLKDLNEELSRKLESQTQRLELLTAQNMANEKTLTRLPGSHSLLDNNVYADEGDEVVERVLGWIMKLFPGGPSRRRTSKLL